MADDRREALRDYGWTEDEGDDQWVSAAHVNTVIILGEAGGWQARMAVDEMVLLAGHSRYQTPLGDWLHRLEEPQPAREA